MNITVLKFGGTSMNDHQTWRKVLEIIRNYEYPVVVVSATARTTRQLIEAGKSAASGDLEQALEIVETIKNRHRELVEHFLDENPHQKKRLIKESCFKKIDEKVGFLKKMLQYAAKKNDLNPALQDSIAAVGEQVSSYLLAQCGLATNQLTQHIEAKKLIKTDAEYGVANPNRALINQKCGSIETVLDSGFTPIIGGFYGEAPDGTTTTLGFEGSDYTASLIGGAIHAQAIEIWTDVSGIYTSDPRFIEDAQPIDELSYFDATEMAYFGAKVLHPATLKPAQERNIPVFVKNMFKADEAGTRIGRESASTKDFLAISFKENMALVTVSAYETVMGYSFLTKVFAALEKLRLPVDAVNTTEASVTIALQANEKLSELSQALIEVGTVHIDGSKGLISLIGCKLQAMDQLSEKVFKALGDNAVDMITFTKEKRILSVVVNENQTVYASRLLHRSVFA
ncbi:MAG: aspartate kinase [Balneolaceae bacterium]|nr:aspartate kinase [Balneolaceae bacterium]